MTKVIEASDGFDRNRDVTPTLSADEEAAELGTLRSEPRGGFERIEIFRQSLPERSKQLEALSTEPRIRAAPRGTIRG